jgi:hypothetical protein
MVQVVKAALVRATVRRVSHGIGGKTAAAGVISISVGSLSESLLRSMLMMRVSSG